MSIQYQAQSPLGGSTSPVEVVTTEDISAQLGSMGLNEVPTGGENGVETGGEMQENAG